MFKLLILTFVFSFTSTTLAIDVSDGLKVGFNPLTYLEKQVPKGVISEYACSDNTPFSFDKKDQCKATCQFGSNIIFTSSNVKNLFFSRSSERVALVVQLFEKNEIEGYEDIIGSFDTRVSCFFSGLILK